MKGTAAMKDDKNELTISVFASGPMALAVLKALGHVDPPTPTPVRAVVMTVGPVTEQP